MTVIFSPLSEPECVSFSSHCPRKGYSPKISNDQPLTVFVFGCTFNGTKSVFFWYCRYMLQEDIHVTDNGMRAP